MAADLDSVMNSPASNTAATASLTLSVGSGRAGAYLNVTTTSEGCVPVFSQALRMHCATSICPSKDSPPASAMTTRSTTSRSAALSSKRRVGVGSAAGVWIGVCVSMTGRGVTTVAVPGLSGVSAPTTT